LLNCDCQEAKISRRALFNAHAPTMQVFGRDGTGEFENVK
jgi:hypothetical protein